MRWADVTTPPPPKLLRQFAGLCLLVFGGLAAYRLFRGSTGTLTTIYGALALFIGVVGLVAPAAVRWFYTTWMVVAFPIGWVLSHVILGLMFGLIFVPVALVFRVMGRDELRIRRSAAKSTYWTVKPAATDVGEYFRQS